MNLHQSWSCLCPKAGILASLHEPIDAGLGLCNDLPHWAFQFESLIKHKVIVSVV